MLNEQGQHDVGITALTMEDSDDEYIDDFDEAVVPRRRHPRRSTGKDKASQQGYSWEDVYYRSWDIVQEDSGGSLAGVIATIVEDSKRKRVLHDTRPLQRGIIRNLVLILDLSFAMSDTDMRPNRYQVMIQNAMDFITEFFLQNPISQLAIVGMRDGLAVMISALDGNPNLHIQTLQDLRNKEPVGVPSLQNALDMARVILHYVPKHCTKEVLVIFGALLTGDPGNINTTMDNLVAERIRVRIIGLAAQVAVCQKLCMKTNYGDTSTYNVALNETHFRSLILEVTTPLAVDSASASNASAVVLMAFPSRVAENLPSLCSCHAKLTKRSYVCPRCESKVCTLPMVCPCCQITLILSTHLARSYHHLFPLANFEQVTSSEKVCYACQSPFNEGHKYMCNNCNNVFCIDCDVFCHESLHNCPGCESRSI